MPDSLLKKNDKLRALMSANGVGSATGMTMRGTTKKCHERPQESGR